MNLDKQALAILKKSMDTLESGFPALPSYASETDWSGIEPIMQTVAKRMHDNYPYHHAYYIGQMLKPPHPIAHIAYTLAMNLNPNNHALDGGRASSEMEKEAVAEIARMFGWDEHLGHLCGGGTMANFEALWVSAELQGRDKIVVASEQSHYTHSRLCAVMGVPFESIASDSIGRMNTAELESRLAKGGVGTVVVTLGTTLSGAVDSLADILRLRERFEFRIHVDTAYGGYFKLVSNLDPHARMAFDAIHEADSIVIDPHKQGLQPYGCGCVLFKDPAVGRIYNHDSPYTYFSSDDLHLGEISLECSRAGASAVALWATQQLLPMSTDGEFAAGLQQGRQAALNLYQWLHETEGFTPLFGPQLDIVCWAVDGLSASQSSAHAKRLFDVAADKFDLHLAVASIPRHMCVAVQSIQDWDQDHLYCLRACAMKPEHIDALPEIQKRLAAALTAA